MNAFGAALMLLVAISGFAVVRTRDVTSQVIALSFYGTLMALVFFFFQAPTLPCRRSRSAWWLCR